MNPTTTSSSFEEAASTSTSTASSMPTTSTATAASAAPDNGGVPQHPPAVFLHTIPEDGSDYGLETDLAAGSSVSVAADTDGSDDLLRRRERRHDEPKSWWKLRTAALLTPSSQLPLSSTPIATPDASLRRLSAAPSIDSSNAEEERTTGVGAPPSSTGAMEAGHAGSIVAVSEAGAVIVGDGPTRNAAAAAEKIQRRRHRRRRDPRRPRRPPHPLARKPSLPLTPEEARRRQLRFYVMILLAILLLVGIVVGIVFAVQSTTSHDNSSSGNQTNHTTTTTSSPTMAPSPTSALPSSKYSTETIQLLDDLLFNITNSSSWIHDTASPRYLARNWLLTVDQLQVVANLTSSSSSSSSSSDSMIAIRRVTQRFLLCLLYWNFDGPENLLNATTHECTWSGIRCYENTTLAGTLNSTTITSTTTPPLDAVHTMAWNNENLTGTLPYEMGHLSWLRNIQMDQNHITGTVPLETWARILSSSSQLGGAELRHVSLYQNQLHGRFISSSSSTTTTADAAAAKAAFALSQVFPNLYYLDLSYNRLTGPMLDWTLWSNLGFLYLSNNHLTGPIVPTSASTTSLLPPPTSSTALLKVLDLSNNRLNGSILLPKVNWKMYTNLEYVLLQNNTLSGRLVISSTAHSAPNSNTSTTTTLFSPLSALTNLIYLDLSFNEFTGPMLDVTPFVLLESLYLSDNLLQGPLGEPPSYGIATNGSLTSTPGSNVSSLDLVTGVASFNGSTPTSASTLPVSGSIPASVYSALTDIRVNNNRLVGTLSSTWAVLDSLKTMVLSGNRLGGTLPTSWSTESLLYLDLSGNLFSGSIPESLLELSSLEDVLLQHNLFTKLPPGNQTSKTLQIVVLDSNELQGTIPPDFGVHWTNLTSLSVRNNSRLTGSLDLCNITDLEADCSQSSSNATPTTSKGVTCTCCTLCN